MKPDQRVFVGVVSPIDPRVETPEEVRDRVLEAARYIPVEQLGTMRRLRVLAVLRRHVHDPRHGVRQDPGPRGRHGLAAEATRRTLNGGERRTRRSTAPLGRPAERPEHPRGPPRAEEALRKQSEWLRITLASIGDAVISTDADGRVTFMNGVAEASDRLAQAEALGRPCRKSSTSSMNEPAGRSRIPPCVPCGRGRSWAWRTTRSSSPGTGRNGRSTTAPRRCGTSRGHGRGGPGLPRRHRAQAGRGGRARLAAIVESSEDAIVSKTLDGVIRSWNAGAERLFGYTAEEAVGQPITLIIPPERSDEERDDPGRLRRGERVEHFETVRVAKDGRRLDISLTISPIRDGTGQVIGASKVARDITERKRAGGAPARADRRKDEFLACWPTSSATRWPRSATACR